MTIFEAIKTALPNFPDEIITLWLEPFANDLGWPPEHDRWRYILGLERGIPFWSQIEWNKENITLEAESFDSRSQEVMRKLFEGYVMGKDNMFTRSLGQNGADRFQYAKNYMRQIGLFPQPPVFIMEPDGLSIIDGNHRMLAYYFLHMARRQGLESAIQLNQSAWIGRFPFVPSN